MKITVTLNKKIENFDLKEIHLKYKDLSKKLFIQKILSLKIYSILYYVPCDNYCYSLGFNIFLKGHLLKLTFMYIFFFVMYTNIQYVENGFIVFIIVEKGTMRRQLCY